MSGLSPVPRIPNRASTMNGNEAKSSAVSATRMLPRSAAPVPASRPRSSSAEPAAATAIAISAAVPSPGRRTVHQASAQSAARPTAGARGEGPRRPQATRIAWPINAAAPSTIRNDA